MNKTFGIIAASGVVIFTIILILTGGSNGEIEVSPDPAALGTETDDSSDLFTFDDDQEQIPSDLDLFNEEGRDPAMETEPLEPPQPINEESGKAFQVVLNTTKGSITIKLNEDETPLAVENFVDLSRTGFYDGTIFHRVIEDFMIQGGCPNGDGTGNPGYNFPDEDFTGDYVRGTVAMANSGPNTNGSQFFIMHEDKNLPRDYVIFGRVIDGMEVVDSIATSDTEMGPMGERSVPVDPVNIISTEVIEI